MGTWEGRLRPLPGLAQLTSSPGGLLVMEEGAAAPAEVTPRKSVLLLERVTSPGCLLGLPALAGGTYFFFFQNMSCSVSF